MRWMLLAAMLWTPQETVIRVPVRLVNVPTMVFAADGKYVFGLEARDFQVLDDGQPRTFTFDTSYLPPSVAVVVQVSSQARQYLPFVSKVGSAVDDLLIGQNGRAALITYDDFVTIRKDFAEGETRDAFHKIVEGGKRARMIDAAIRGVELLREQPADRSRVLLLIGQAMDKGSSAAIDTLQEMAERENVTIYALALPQFNKAFVEDTFSLEGLSSHDDRGGFKASANLSRLAPALAQAEAADANADAFTRLTRATGGTQLHFRTQRALEDAVGIVGTEIRSVYTLSFRPGSGKPGYHTIRVEVKLPGATAYARRGYRLAE